MRRRLFNVAAAVSLVLCLASLAGWMRSCWVYDNVGRVGQAKVVAVTSAAGTLHVSVSRAYPENDQPGPRPYYFWYANNVAKFGGVYLDGKVLWLWAEVRRPGYGFLVAPYWLLVLATLPGAWLSLVGTRRSILAKVRRNYGHCPNCGYDLRATPERCPECGTEANPRPAEGTAA